MPAGIPRLNRPEPNGPTSYHGTTRPLDPVSTSIRSDDPPSTATFTVGSLPIARVSGMSKGPDADDAARAAAGSAADGNAKSNELRLLSRLSVQLVMSVAAAGSKAANESVN